jgi:hypothetical protein
MVRPQPAVSRVPRTSWPAPSPCFATKNCGPRPDTFSAACLPEADQITAIARQVKASRREARRLNHVPTVPALRSACVCQTAVTEFLAPTSWRAGRASRCARWLCWPGPRALAVAVRSKGADRPHTALGYRLRARGSRASAGPPGTKPCTPLPWRRAPGGPRLPVDQAGCGARAPGIRCSARIARGRTAVSPPRWPGSFTGSASRLGYLSLAFRIAFRGAEIGRVRIGRKRDLDLEGA